MSSHLDRGFKSTLRESALDDVEDELLDEYAENFVDLVHTRLRSFGQTHGYDVESTIDSFEGVDISRTRNGISLTVSWASEQMDFWEFGTSPHTIRGDPLSFVWEDPPEWVRQEFEQARTAEGQFASGWRVFLPEVDHPGTPASRAIRESLAGLGRLLRS